VRIEVEPEFVVHTAQYDVLLGIIVGFR